MPTLEAGISDLFILLHEIQDAVQILKLSSGETETRQCWGSAGAVLGQCWGSARAVLGQVSS